MYLASIIAWQRLLVSDNPVIFLDGHMAGLVQMNLLEPVVFLDPPGGRFLLNSSGSRRKEAVRSRMESSGDMAHTQ